MTSPKPSHKNKTDFTPNSETFRLLFAHHPTPMWMYDLKTLAFLEVNDVALEKYGYTRDEFLALTIKDIRPTEDVTRLVNTLEQKHPGLNHSGECRHRLKNGQVIDVEVTTHILDFEGHSAELITAQDIAERKRAEEALQRNEEILRLFIQWSPAAIAMFDRDMKYIVASKRYLIDYGLGERNFIGHSHYEIFPEISDRWKEIHQRCMAGSIESCNEDPFPRADGQLDWVKWEIHPWHETTGEVGGIILFSEVITERKQMEEKLKESLSLLRVAEKSAKLGGWSVDLERNRVIWSDEVRAIHETPAGFSPSSVEEGISFYAPEWRERISKVFSDCAQKGIPYDEKLEIITATGKRIWVRITGEAVKDNNGKIIKVHGAFQDINERKQAEELVRQSETRWRTLILNLTSFIAEASPDGIIMALNHVQEGFSLEDYVGRSLFDVVAPDSREQFKKVFSQVLEFVETVGYEAPEFGANHEPSWYYRELIPIVQEGKVHSILMVADDITERKQAEQKLAQYSELLEGIVDERTRDLHDAQEKLVRQEKLAVLGQLAGGVGHELRNPLAVINNALYYLKLVGADGNEKLREYLGIIETEARTAERIITDLLDFARIKSVDVEAVSVSQLVTRVLERYTVPNAVSVRLEIPKELPMLYADPRQMEQVLGNLVINACQAIVSATSTTLTSTGSGEAKAGGELVIGAYQEQEMVAIAVQDNGVGITPENMKKLFEPLFTTKAKGIGLGLAVSQKLAEANGGRIEVESEAGKGSTFTIYLPVSKRNWNES